MSASIQPAAPFSRLLAPLDGSALAEAILPAAARIAAACHARLILLHVLEHDAPQTVHGQRHLDEVAAAEAYLQAVAGRLAGAGIEIEAHVHPNKEHDVARSIAEHSRELGVDLIALTTHGSSGLRGLLFGSIAQQTLRQTRAPVLVVRPGQTVGGDDGPIMVALDGGAEAELALPVAAMLAEATGAPLHLLRVVRTTAAERGSPAAVGIFVPTAAAALLDIEEQEARDYLARLVAGFPEGIVATAEVRRGDPSDEIVRVAREGGMGLLVATTHGRAGLESIIAGSVIPRALPRLSVPLLLIRIDGESAG